MGHYHLKSFLVTGFVLSFAVAETPSYNSLDRNKTAHAPPYRPYNKEINGLHQGKNINQNVSNTISKINIYEANALIKKSRHDTKHGPPIKSTNKRRLFDYQRKNTSAKSLDVKKTKTKRKVYKTNNLSRESDLTTTNSNSKKASSSASVPTNDRNFKSNNGLFTNNFEILITHAPSNSTVDNQIQEKEGQQLRKQYKKVRIIQRMPNLSTEEKHNNTKNTNYFAMVLRKSELSLKEIPLMPNPVPQINQSVPELQIDDDFHSMNILNEKEYEIVSTKSPMHQTTTPTSTATQFIAGTREKTRNQERLASASVEKQEVNHIRYGPNHDRTFDRSENILPIRRRNNERRLVTLLSRPAQSTLFSSLNSDDGHYLFPSSPDVSRQNIRNRMNSDIKPLPLSLENVIKGIHGDENSTPLSRHNIVKKINSNIEPMPLSRQNIHKEINSDKNPNLHAHRNVLERIPENIKKIPNFNANNYRSNSNYRLHPPKNQNDDSLSDWAFSDDISDIFFDDEFDVSDSFSLEFDDFDKGGDTSENTYLADRKFQGLLFLSPLQKTKSINQTKNEKPFGKNENSEISRNTAINKPITTYSVVQHGRWPLDDSLVNSNTRPRNAILRQQHTRADKDNDFYSDFEYESESYEFYDDSEYEYDANDKVGPERKQAFADIYNGIQRNTIPGVVARQQGPFQTATFISRHSARNNPLPLPPQQLLPRQNTKTHHHEYVLPGRESNFEGHQHPNPPRHVASQYRINDLYRNRIMQNNNKNNQLRHTQLKNDKNDINVRNVNIELQRQFLFNRNQQRQSVFRTPDKFADFEYIDSDNEYGSDGYYDDDEISNENDDYYSDEYYDEPIENDDAKSGNLQVDESKTDPSFKNSTVIPKQNLMEHIMSMEWTKDS